jgi:RNA polymerase sigma-70 factor, ECF subfamily
VRATDLVSATDLANQGAADGEAPGEVTRWLRELRGGDRQALDRVVTRLYGELRAIARQRLGGEWSHRPMVTTELVHEAYLRLLRERRLAVEDRAEFFAAAANVMRRVLVDAARARRRRKRGGGKPDLPLDADAQLPLDELGAGLSDREAAELLALETALERLRALHPRGAEVVMHRYFGGLTLEESAQVLGVSAKTVQRDWLAARAWLRKEIGSALDELP